MSGGFQIVLPRGDGKEDIEIVASPWTSPAYVIPECQDCDEPATLSVDVSSPPIPLADFRLGYVSIGGNVGKFIDNFAVVCVDDDDKNADDNDKDSLQLKLFFCRTARVRGNLLGLAEEDIACFQRGEYDGDHILQFLRTGDGFQNPTNVTFTPTDVRMVMDGDLHARINICGRIPYQDEEEDDEYFGEEISFPLSDAEKDRLSIINALGCNESHQKLLGENERLNKMNFRMKNICDRLSNVEILYSNGKFTVPVTEGRMLHEPLPALGPGTTQSDEDHSFWSIVLYAREDPDFQMFAIPANDMLDLKVNIGGTCHWIYAVAISPRFTDAGNRHFIMEFQNGPILHGQLDGKHGHLSEDEFREIHRGFMESETRFPEDYILLLTRVDFPHWCHDEALEVLESISDNVNLQPFEFDLELDSESDSEFY